MLVETKLIGISMEMIIALELYRALYGMEIIVRMKREISDQLIV